jgi:hypothetical protein
MSSKQEMPWLRDRLSAGEGSRSRAKAKLLPARDVAHLWSVMGRQP